MRVAREPQRRARADARRPDRAARDGELRRGHPRRGGDDPGGAGRRRRRGLARRAGRGLRRGHQPPRLVAPGERYPLARLSRDRVRAAHADRRPGRRRRPGLRPRRGRAARAGRAPGACCWSRSCSAGGTSACSSSTAATRCRGAAREIERAQLLAHQLAAVHRPARAHVGVSRRRLTGPARLRGMAILVDELREYPGVALPFTSGATWPPTAGSTSCTRSRRGSGCGGPGSSATTTTCRRTAARGGRARRRGGRDRRAAAAHDRAARRPRPAARARARRRRVAARRRRAGGAALPGRRAGGDRRAAGGRQVDARRRAWSTARACRVLDPDETRGDGRDVGRGARGLAGELGAALAAGRARWRSRPRCATGTGWGWRRRPRRPACPPHLVLLDADAATCRAGRAAQGGERITDGLFEHLLRGVGGVPPGAVGARGDPAPFASITVVDRDAATGSGGFAADAWSRVSVGGRVLGELVRLRTQSPKPERGLEPLRSTLYKSGALPTELLRRDAARV